MLLVDPDEPSFFQVGRAVGAHHQTVQRGVERALVYGALAALDDRPRSGKEPAITAEVKAWLVSLACRKAKDLGYPHELWTTRLLARHAREHGPAEGQACLAKLVQGRCEQEVKPHKVRYYLERRDPEFKQKMAEVLCVYREVKLIKETRRPENKNRAMRWRLSPTMRSRAFRRSPRPLRTCRPSPADMRPSRATTS